jgi:NAD-dependent deacetylase
VHPPVDSPDPNRDLERAVALLAGAERVAVLTGAGISAESGVPTFRDAGGLWEGHRVEDVATPEAFQRDPTLVWRFYNLRRANMRTIQPNPGHRALVALEQHYGAEWFTLITQNIDGLHAAAGSQGVLELHGNLARVRCTGCGKIENRGWEALADLPHCAGCARLLRPDVVWFHEALPESIWEKAMVDTYRCHCFLVIGTSAVVYPAAGLVNVARASGARVIEVNLQATEVTHKVDVALHGPSGQILPRLVEMLQASKGEQP